MRWLVSILVTVSGAGFLGAQQQTPECVVCEKAVAGPFYTMTTPLFAEAQVVCAACSRIKQRCFECNLPVKAGVRALPDGRFLCRRHAQTAVFSAAEAESLFKEVKRDLMPMFAGSGRLPDQNIEIQLVDRGQLQRQVVGKPWINAQAAVGLTETTQVAPGRMRHRIYLLTGLPRPHFEAVAAHEYGHTWVAENVSRRLLAKTVEGFCELVAYNLMTQRKEEAQKRVILANAYTGGQIASLRLAEDRYQFHRVLEWMKRGKDEAMPGGDVTRLLALKSPPRANLPSYRQVKTPVPDTLQLRGISGTELRRFALVNDCTLEKSEQAKVRVGSSNVTVRCLDITDRTVVLKLMPSGRITELSLRPE